MPGGASIDWEGRPVSEEEVARGLGFVNVEAFRAWRLHRDTKDDSAMIRWLSAEMCNLKEQVRILEGRLTATGTERIG